MRVVVTGMGVLTPVGNSIEDFWQGLVTGRSGIARITRFDVDDYPSQIAGEIKGFDPSGILEKKEMRRMDLAEQYALVASEEAVTDSGLDLEAIDLDRCGVIIGSGIGGIETFEKQHLTLVNSGPGRVSPFFIPMMIIDMCAGMVSMRYNFRGPNYATVSACASSAHALADAFRCIQRGEADVMLTGGSEATITPSALAGFCQAKALSTRNDEPERASRPFDKDRDGFVMSEGAGILVLESLEHAQKRGARIYGEILGVGMTADAYHMTAPHPEGDGARRAMQMALRDADLAPEQINYINAHGTSTLLNDVVETKAIKVVFGDHAYKIPCNSTKSMTGHLLGSGGAVECITVFKQMEQKQLHPTINLDEPDPECDLDYVANQPRDYDIRFALSTSLGFGGHNITIALGRVNGKE